MNSEKEIVNDMLKEHELDWVLGYLICCQHFEKYINNGIDYTYCLKYLEEVIKPMKKNKLKPKLIGL